MATIQDALRTGAIKLHQTSEWESRAAVRSLYVAEDFWEWTDSVASLHTMKSGGRTLYEHIEQGLNDMLCARRPSGGDLNRIDPHRDGIWKLKVEGVRIFGWFCAQNEFVVVAGELKTELKAAPKLHDALQKKVMQFARRHGLTDTILMGDLKDVLSH